MKLGIIGLPNVGKSTLFNSMTLAKAEAAFVLKNIAGKKITYPVYIDVEERTQYIWSNIAAIYLPFNTNDDIEIIYGGNAEVD